MIKPKCSKCGEELKDYGAVLISPPISPTVEPHLTMKYHICLKCWDALKHWINLK